MKLTILPTIDVSLEINNQVTNKIVNQSLFDKIHKKKQEIDNVKYKWDSAKKISNDYEYIYTSSNTHKNISNITPVSRSFFKLREIIYEFKLQIHTNCACIAEAPGGFIQSILVFCGEKKISLSKINGITLVSTDKDIPYWNPTLITNPKVCICNGKDGTGDLYKLSNVLDFIRYCGKQSCSLVTGDGGFDYTKDFEQELSSYKLFYSEILICLNIQSEGGTFVCKLFDLFWYSSLQLVYILYISYESISFIKPSTSRQSNSEKYIVCRGFKGYNKQLINLMCHNFENTILPIQLPDEFIDMIEKYHKQFINHQMKRIDTTLQLISQRRNLDKPSKQQIHLAIEWCKKYEISINKTCYYLSSNSRVTKRSN